MATTEELWSLSSSDLSVEEKLAAGASVSDLISAGVLHDDYPAGHKFASEEDVSERDKQNVSLPPMSDAEFEQYLSNSFKYCKLATDHRNKTT